MSHELRTPLNGILGYAQILQRDANLTENGSKGLQSIYENGKYLLMLIEDVLDLAKVEAGRLELHPQELHFPPFIDSIVALMNMSAQQKDLQFDYQVDGHLPTFILADEKRLRQVLLNLIGNAIKFTQKGQVQFIIAVDKPHKESSQEDSCRLSFSIKDTGIGISQDQLDTIFKPFAQVGPAAQQAKGTGLGLSISQELVQLMGGEIEIESELKYGSQFSFAVIFPVLQEHVVQTAVSPIVRGYAGKKQHLLVVDDHPENQAVLLNYLEPLGFKITLASNGQEAIQRTQQQSPDLILMDIVLPDMSGYDVIRILRSDPNFVQVPIIAVSASVNEFEKNQSQQLGCNAFLPKPIEMEQLLQLLTNELQIEWLFDEKENRDATQTKQENVTVIEITPPQKSELMVLYELARTGNILIDFKYKLTL